MLKIPECVNEETEMGKEKKNMSEEKSGSKQVTERCVK